MVWLSKDCGLGLGFKVRLYLGLFVTTDLVGEGFEFDGFPFLLHEFEVFLERVLLLRNHAYFNVII